MNTDQSDLFASTAEELRDIGIARAAQSSGEDWQNRAFHFLEEWCLAHRTPFFLEEVRLKAEELGMDPPPDRRAWGAVAIRAAKQRMIRRVGYGPQRVPNAHCAPKSIWISAGSRTGGSDNGR